MPSLLLFGDTMRSAALRHEVPIAIVDGLLFAEHEGRAYVLTTMLEHERVRAALPGAELLDMFALGFKDLVQGGGLSVEDAEREVTVRAVQQIGIASAVVPGDFPLGLAERLRGNGIELAVDDAAVRGRRRSKSPDELAGIRAAQRAAEAAMTAARDLLRRATPDGEGLLTLDGEPLLAEAVRDVLRSACARAGTTCPPEIMVRSVLQGTGHDPGTGPLPAGLPISIDLWPQHEESGCWADMTRTFVAGDLAPEHAGAIRGRHALVLEAHEAAIAAIRPGVSGRAVFDLACERFEAAGFKTQRTTDDPEEEEGFQWSLGHGVGLEMHEPPWLGLGGREPLVEGDVVALEPGLHDATIGEVRVEDLVLVTADGAERLTQFPYDL